MRVSHIVWMTTLSEYMQRESLGDEDVARLVGRSRTRISRIRRGLENPSLELALDIERVTGGAVKPADLYVAPTSGEAA